MALMPVILAWYVSGLIGSALFLEFGFRRSRSIPLDIEVKDLLFGMLLAIAGPFSTLVGVGFAVAWLIGGLMDTERVIFKAKHRD